MSLMSGRLLVLLVTAGVWAGCLWEPNSDPLSNSRLILAVQVPAHPAANSSLPATFLLENQGPERARVDPPALGEYYDSIIHLIIEGPNATYQYRPNPVAARASGRYWGEDSLECRDVRDLNLGERLTLNAQINESLIPNLRLEPGAQHRLTALYSTQCLKATWRGNLTATTTFTPQ